MPVYLVSYDLRTPGQKYEALIARITQYKDTKKALYSAYLINTDHTSQQVFDYIKTPLDSNDCVLVTTVTKEHSGRMPQEVWDWLKPRL